MIFVRRSENRKDIFQNNVTLSTEYICETHTTINETSNEHYIINNLKSFIYKGFRRCSIFIMLLATPNSVKYCVTQEILVSIIHVPLTKINRVMA